MRANRRCHKAGAETVTIEIKIPISQAATLVGDLAVPAGARGLVIFAHGSGSSRRSPRNRFVAEHLQGKNIATLLVDLLSVEEDENYATRFDIELLTRRLLAITEWCRSLGTTKNLHFGYFGASTGAAAAMFAAASPGNTIKAIVSRGGRVDLAASVAPSLTPATLFIVGGNDPDVAAANETVFNTLKSTKNMQSIAGATHLFEEPGALEQVAHLASDWFYTYLQ